MGYHVVLVRRYHRGMLLDLINKIGIRIISMQRVDCVNGVCYELLIYTELRKLNKLRRKCIDHAVNISVDELGL